MHHLHSNKISQYILRSPQKAGAMLWVPRPQQSRAVQAQQDKSLRTIGYTVCVVRLTCIGRPGVLQAFNLRQQPPDTAYRGGRLTTPPLPPLAWQGLEGDLLSPAVSQCIYDPRHSRASPRTLLHGIRGCWRRQEAGRVTWRQQTESACGGPYHPSRLTLRAIT